MIVSIATIPSRIAKMKPTLDSLLAGDLAPELILVNTPLFCELEQSGYDLPDFLRDSEMFDGRVRHVFSAMDWGPGTKILGPLPHLPLACILIIADDDIIYHRAFVQRLVEAQSKRYDRAHSYYVYRAAGMRVGQGCDGLSIWSPHLEGLQAFVAAHVAGTELVYHDDIWIAFYLLTRGVRITPVAVPAGAKLVYEQHLPNTVLALQTGRLDRMSILAAHLPRLLRDVELSRLVRRRLALRDAVERTTALSQRGYRKLWRLASGRRAAGARKGKIW